ncbi:protein indeterminate-domain 16-like isoform X2 [Salvia hispanica]|uniref:protein indeterminate-domain 16-like isoform X2 n=1 Tax=Salvia hispanica TaxID=49212 RepID=UPI002009154E|nr:protein indeterminate-domain 16-like isoform X2 [Salvia hispanica]XP_047956913.1 protein indeterminate-domain 16-like isoform X2 [Salvia hispanica]
MEGSHQEMQLFSCAAAAASPLSKPGDHDPPLDLQLSISLSTPAMRKMRAPPSCVEALRWQAAEQIRLATTEKAYAERVRELTRREMEMAQSEFARARAMWERAREELQRAERIKERLDSISATCHSCGTQQPPCIMMKEISVFHVQKYK